MKQRKYIAIVCLMMMAMSTGAFAHQGDGGLVPKPKAAQRDQLAALEKFLQSLYDADAIEIDEDGKIHINKDVVKELKLQGRWYTEMASSGSICN